MATTTKPAMIAAWVVGLIVILGIVGWAAGWFGGPKMAQQTGEQPPAAETQLETPPAPPPPEPAPAEQPAAPAEQPAAPAEQPAAPAQ